MPDIRSAHTERARAGSFGAAAEAYDAHRPRYPDALIEALGLRPGARVLDVGAGTGIAADQLRAAGAEVLAVEPDPRMAALARARGLEVEEASFETWAPAGRSFDLVVFAQSFHWVDPEPALARVREVLRPGGRLALLVNRVVPSAPTQAELDTVNADYLPEIEATSTAGSDDGVGEVTGQLERAGFVVETVVVPERRRYTTTAYLDLLATYSHHLLLDPGPRAELRTRLAHLIGPGGVRTHNDALALIGTPIG